MVDVRRRPTREDAPAYPTRRSGPRPALPARQSTAAVVPVFASPGVGARRVEDVLAGIGPGARRCQDWDHFRHSVSHVDVGVLVAPWIELDLPLLALGDMVTAAPWLALVLLTDPDPENLRSLGAVRVSAVLFLGREEHRLRDTLHAVRLGSSFPHWAARLSVRPELPPILRDGVLIALESGAAPLPTTVEESDLPPRSIRELARRIHCSPEYLGRVARQAGFPLADFLKWCVALRALQLRETRAGTWESVAWRLGFNSLGALSEHLNTTLGVRPSRLRRGDAGSWFQRFETRFVTGT